MGWTSPATWSVNEIVTAAKMNLHVRDNLNYLKGTSGAAVTIENGMNVGSIASGASDGEIRVKSAAAASRYVRNENTDAGGVAGFYAVNDSGVGIAFQAIGSSEGATGLAGYGRLVSDSSLNGLVLAALGNKPMLAYTNANERLRITGGGDVGINRATPQGRLHGYDTISGFLHWEFDGVDGTARTVIPDGAGDVVYSLMAMFVVRDDTGAVTSSTAEGVSLTPGNQLTIHSNGDVFSLRVNANGSVDVRRSSGTTRTIKIGLWCLWI